jgi:hypothetical protein
VYDDIHVYQTELDYSTIFDIVEQNGDGAEPNSNGPSWSTPTKLNQDFSNDLDHEDRPYFFHAVDADAHLSNPINNVYFYGSGNHPASPGGIYLWTADDFAGTNITFEKKVISQAIERKIRTPSTFWDPSNSQWVMFTKDDDPNTGDRQTYRFTSTDGENWTVTEDGNGNPMPLLNLNTEWQGDHAGNMEVDFESGTLYGWTNRNGGNGVPTTVHESTDAGINWNQGPVMPRVIPGLNQAARRPLGSTFKHDGQRWAVCIVWPPGQGSGTSMSNAKIIQIPISQDRQRYVGPPELLFDPANDGSLDGVGDLQQGSVRVFGSTSHLWICVDDDVYHTQASL